MTSRHVGGKAKTSASAPPFYRPVVSETDRSRSAAVQYLQCLCPSGVIYVQISVAIVHVAHCSATLRHVYSMIKLSRCKWQASSIRPTQSIVKMGLYFRKLWRYRNIIVTTMLLMHYFLCNMYGS